MNISPRLVAYAAKVLDHGCPELIAAVESGALKVSAAAMLADLPRERQIEEISRGPGRAARARRLAAQLEAERHPIGSFGRVPQGGAEQKVRLLLIKDCGTWNVERGPERPEPTIYDPRSVLR